MKSATWVSALRLLALPQWTSAAEPQIAVTVSVVDEHGAPVPAADVTVSYQKSEGARGARATTDSQGQARTTGRTYHWIDIGVKKPGYYDSWRERLTPYQVKNGQRVYADQAVTLGLRPIRNPIPMHARLRYQTRIPVADKPVGFDLLEGDWVAPYGKGRTADFLFTASGSWKSAYEYDYALTLSFPNEGDGVVPFDAHPTSQFISPFEAPLAGYQPKKSWRQSRARSSGPGPGPRSPADTIVDDVSEQANYMFRVRTVLDRDGKIVSALYGKLYGDPRFGAPVGKGAYLDLTYYLNPTPNDRNLEADWRRNLATGLKSYETPTRP